MYKSSGVEGAVGTKPFWCKSCLVYKNTSGVKGFASCVQVLVL